MKVAFLDRDGVINIDAGYTHKIEEFEFTTGCVGALQTLQALGYELIIVTNQSGIGRGYYSQQDYEKLTEWYLEALSQQGIKILDVFYCPHTPETDCDCRKPKPGLFLQAKEKFPSISINDSIMFGDKVSDLQAAESAGIETGFLIEPPETLNSVVSQQFLKDKN
jgi:D-glycero-D-manno-heptose 1,7-bisphosphate phosphatase